ncbi:aldehyde dehydrogenase family protein, partial [Acinetobacter baumannii]
ETLRIDGAKPDNDRRIEVFNPYDNALIGTVPKATVADVERAFAVAADYRPKLSRHDRSVILRRTADILRRDADRISDLI